MFPIYLLKCFLKYLYLLLSFRTELFLNKLLIPIMNFNRIKYSKLKVMSIWFHFKIIQKFIDESINVNEGGNKINLKFQSNLLIWMGNDLLYILFQIFHYSNRVLYFSFFSWQLRFRMVSGRVQTIDILLIFQSLLGRFLLLMLV
jgi:hypothetical protein